jgi:hypothetical protein
MRALPAKTEHYSGADVSKFRDKTAKARILCCNEIWHAIFKLTLDVKEK